jgi:hypothetical protein
VTDGVRWIGDGTSARTSAPANTAALRVNTQARLRKFLPGVGYFVRMDREKPREPRRVVLVTCRMRYDNGWADLTICNLSSRGLMAKCADPPPRGTFVEVRRGAVCVVGQVRWTYAGRLGIRTQEQIDVDGLLGEAPAKTSGTQERRQGSRGEERGKPKETSAALAERSRRWGRLFDWIVVTAIAIGSAGLLVSQVHSILSAPLDQVRTALAD